MFKKHFRSLIVRSFGYRWWDVEIAGSSCGTVYDTSRHLNALILRMVLSVSECSNSRTTVQRHAIIIIMIIIGIIV
jgi:hypothetical protein